MVYEDSQKRKMEGAIRRLREADYPESDIELLMEFKDYLLAEGLSPSRIARYLTTFRTLAPSIDFRLSEAEKQDLIGLVGQINQDMLNEKEYSVWTKAEFKKGFKKFYKWQEGSDEPEIIDFISVQPKRSKRELADPDDLPGPEDVDRLVKWMQNCRDEAFVQVVWESGGRIGEVLSLKWEDFVPKERLATLKLRGKTGERKVPVQACREALRLWREAHPHPEPDNHIFTGLRAPTQISYNAMRKQLQNAADEARVECDINFHAFRKGRATFLAKKGMNVFQLMKFFGWTDPETAMTYVRMAHSDLEEAFLEICVEGKDQGSDSGPLHPAGVDISSHNPG